MQTDGTPGVEFSAMVGQLVHLSLAFSAATEASKERGVQ